MVGVALGGGRGHGKGYGAVGGALPGGRGYGIGGVVIVQLAGLWYGGWGYAVVGGAME